MDRCETYTELISASRDGALTEAEQRRLEAHLADAVDAARAAGMIGAELSIPMHYDTFPVIRQDPERFRALAAARGCKAAVLRPGESIRL